MYHILLSLSSLGPVKRLTGEKPVDTGGFFRYTVREEHSSIQNIPDRGKKTDDGP